MTRYLLSSNAHLCVEGGQLIVLDLRSGKYLGVDLPEVFDLGRFICGLPRREQTLRTASDVSEHELVQALRGLEERGVLTTNPADGHPVTPAQPINPSIYLLDLPLEHPVVIRADHVWIFFEAVVVTYFSLRFLSLKYTINRVRRRKTSRDKTEKRSDLERVLSLVTVFNDLRPFAFGRPDQCLFHSLALLEFLARYRIFPEWLFGVRTAPFRAHSWLQMDKVSLSDSLMSIAEFTPLMVV